MNENTQFPGRYQSRLSEALLSDALYTYVFDVTTGMIEEDIISQDGSNYMKIFGLTSPYSFDEIIERSFNNEYLHIEYTLDSSVQKLSCDELMKAYNTGKRRIEVKVYLAEKQQYNRLTYLLVREEESGHIIAYVMCQDITEIEEQWIRENNSAQKELIETLEETKKQKRLLQEALDNYKQADYDCRIDFLTGLRNRQDMYELLQDTLSGKRDSIKAMFMMDIDNFKMLNDNYGHTVGDECLRKIGEALIQYGKEHDMYFYRYGGEEMLGISFGAEKKEEEIAQELVQLIYDLQLKREDVERGVVTISLGYTCDNQQYEKMIDKADIAMYRAKANGKNQAVCYEERTII